MARTWDTPPGRPQRGWWLRHWANPNFSGGLIGVVCVLLVMTVGVAIAAQTLHLTWADLDVARYFRR